jgi:hypothetical protein
LHRERTRIRVEAAAAEHELFDLTQQAFAAIADRAQERSRS